MFSLRFKVHPQILKKMYMRNWPRLQHWWIFASTVSFIIKFAGKIFQDIIISVFSINVCTHICYNGWGGPNSSVLISPPHKSCDLFWLVRGSIYCRRSIPPTCKYRRYSWVKNIYHPNNHNAYNQVTQITHSNSNCGMLDVSSHF